MEPIIAGKCSRDHNFLPFGFGSVFRILFCAMSVCAGNGRSGSCTIRGSSAGASAIDELGRTEADGLARHGVKNGSGTIDGTQMSRCRVGGLRNDTSC